MINRKQRIKKAFSNSADYYHIHAKLQKQVAERLARALEPWQYSIPGGSIVEIGAGTGFFSDYLAKMFPNRHVIISDISGAMLEKCKKNIRRNENLEFKVLDAERYEWPDSTYSLIAGNFVVQWFKNPSITLIKMMEALKPGGLLLLSFPGSESYPQWKKYCRELGLPFTGNKLPDVEQVVINLSTGPVKVDFYEDQSTETYSDLFEFFRHLKNSGTGVSTGKSRLTPKQMRLLNDYWLDQNNGKITVHYHTAFIAVKRDL